MFNMKRNKSQVNLNQLLHDVPESTQEVIRGGTSYQANDADSTQTAEAPTIGAGGYLRIKKLSSGG